MVIYVSCKAILGTEVHYYSLFEEQKDWKYIGVSQQMSELKDAKKVVENGTRLSEDAIKRINDMHDADTLADVTVVG